MMTRVTSLAILLIVAGLITVSAQAQIDNRSAVDLSWKSVNPQASSMNCGGCEAKSDEKKGCCKEGTCDKEGGCKAAETKKEEGGCTKEQKAEGGSCRKAEAAQ
ncbi:MAG: hypothetical protein H8E17_20470 [Deltaproteobacteria bacterium]|nr:hypothetical protein [Deltaproteobacteria bacterium]